MSNLIDIDQTCLSSVPCWTLPEYDHLLHQKLKNLELQSLVDCPLNKAQLVDFILQKCQGFQSPVVHGPDKYRSMCLRYHSNTSPAIYRELIKSFPVDISEREPHPYLTPDLLSSLKHAISNCPSCDLQLLLLSGASEITLGRRGIWSDIVDSGKDYYYYQLAARGFKDDHLWYIWQFAAHCSDWACQYACAMDV